jgi:hypothetical protein
MSSKVKYLELTLDKEVTWEKQLNRVTNMAYKAFWTGRGLFGGTEAKGGTLDIHHGLRPIVTYTATVWWPTVKFKTSKAELSKLQRMVCLGTTGAPKAAVEVFIGPPTGLADNG